MNKKVEKIKNKKSLEYLRELKKVCIKNGNINEFKAGFYFSRGIEQEFIQSERYNYYCDSRGWICVIYKFLEELNELEN